MFGSYQPGSIFGGLTGGLSDAYQQLNNVYQWQSQTMASHFGMSQDLNTWNLMVPPPAVEPAKSECAEFAWLRQRVNEILWK